MSTNRPILLDLNNPVPASNGSTLKSIRVTRKVRERAYRDGDFMRFLSLHFDHDSAYG